MAEVGWSCCIADLVFEDGELVVGALGMVVSPFNMPEQLVLCYICTSLPSCVYHHIPYDTEFVTYFEEG